MRRSAGILILILFFHLPIRMFCQQVEVRADNKPLNEVLIGISGTYGIQLSFDDRSLSKFSVTLSETFDSPESALLKLLEGLPFELNKNGEVFVIIKKKNPARARSFSINGLILEKGTMEPLPYSLVSINGNALAADLKGSFSYISSTDSIFQVKASHLGYYILDTVVNAGATVHFLLSPSVIGLSEVVIKNSVIERTTQAGREAGVMKLNHQVANFLPGFGDNSVFNLLRLQPGILASGEETNDLIIWGCYEGQSKVLFDGFTIYGLKNFNDNISSFNPLMAKDIEVYKGGYDARFGERVGGIVNVTGKNGNMEKTSFSVNLNNMTLNGMVEIPVGKSGSLVFALRHTYYELYNPGDVNSVLKQAGRDSLNNVDVNIVPDYRFRDLNLKYSAKIHDQDLFYISLYAGNDKFSYSIDQPVNNLYITKNTQEKNTQSGGSVFYGKNWKNGYSTNFSFTYSNLKSNYTDDLTVEKIQQQQIKNKSNLVAENIIRENTIQVDNRFPINESNILEGGLYLIGNRIELQEDTFNIQQASFDDQARRVTIYFQDNVSFIKKIDVKAGFRLTQAINLSRLYLEPRISTSVKLGEMFRINAAWGIYDQFVTKSSIVDDMGNYRYIWTVCNNEDIPILNAMHYVLGTSFNYNAWTVSLEGYYKDVSGLTRYVRNTANNLEGIYQGQGRSYGLDVMVKKDYKWFSGWVSYTLGKTEELFEYFITEEYRRAPQDQRHEVKLAALFNVDPFYFSADYVFGSGFPATRQILDQNPDNLTYSRLDVAAIYKFLDRRIKGEAGLSVLNVLNTENIKYANFERVSTKQTNSINIYSEAIPITPALYLKISM